MAKSARRAGKAKASTTPSSSGASSPSSQTGPLPPFMRAPSSLQPFLDILSPREVYLIHVDNSPQEMKKQAFLVPVVLNIVIVAIIAIRIYMVREVYPALFATLIGLTSSMNVDTTTMSWSEIAQTIIRRTGTFLIDYFLLTIFVSWPIRFIQGPVTWRRRIGFLNREIIVRRSQRSLSDTLERNRWIREDDAARDKIVAAVTPDKLLKTGFLLVDADWDLDYPAMVRAHNLVSSPRTRKDNNDSKDKPNNLSLDDFRTAVLVNTDADGWLIWHVGDENEISNPNSSSPSPSSPAGKERSAQRDQIIAFRDRLSALGKEDLFFRWVELIQYESTRPGGFTPERQASAMEQVKQLFEEAGVDFSQFWDDVGGMEGMPGEGFVDQLD
ncbi:hypothetical protein P168DRAFT_308418 [Aspergillus campestris IBT 28561]|uniref:Uncharacterized protein n=1 Tax=Aspergillus campestris (strain IBT 28561) TaxID=1392248 RepID=A0A2I1DEQ5_ASPC2|nr:uncharacterized protein P168DRAFT_308418 [Aspergillus campestris IBT 28561]PKY08369.1 hypothetical protein P168DRAFT_308418 [Aspergillus campestris IBT 28561]